MVGYIQYQYLTHIIDVLDTYNTIDLGVYNRIKPNYNGLMNKLTIT